MTKTITAPTRARLAADTVMDMEPPGTLVSFGAAEPVGSSSVTVTVLVAVGTGKLDVELATGVAIRSKFAQASRELSLRWMTKLKSPKKPRSLGFNEVYRST